MTQTVKPLFIYIYTYNNIINDHTHIYNVIDDVLFIILLPSRADTSGEKCLVSPTNKSSNCDVDHNGVLSASFSDELKDPNTSFEVETRRPREPLTALVTAGLMTFEFWRRFVVIVLLLLFEVDGETERGTCEGFKSTT